MGINRIRDPCSPPPEPRLSFRWPGRYPAVSLTPELHFFCYFLGAEKDNHMAKKKEIVTLERKTQKL